MSVPPCRARKLLSILTGVDGQVAEFAQAASAGAKIVNGESSAGIADARHDRRHLGILGDGGFGDFQVERARRNAASRQNRPEQGFEARVFQLAAGEILR